MGNSTSSANITTRKSTAGRASDKKLDEEFSDLILHQVQSKKDAALFNYPRYANLDNDLIEDEFNELNSGLLEEATEISRNFFADDVEMTDASKIAPQVAQASKTPLFEPHDRAIAVEIKWVNSNKENIKSIAIIGSFSNWRDVIRLSPSPTHPGEYITTLSLPLGVHKLLYIINNEYRVSDQLPTATDQEGILFNWFEVMDDTHLFNHSLNQPNHLNASTDYDANIIPANFSFSAGKYEVDRINSKANSLLEKLTKEASDFEHVEHMEHVEHVTEHMEVDAQHKDEKDKNKPKNEDFNMHLAPSIELENNGSFTKYEPFSPSTSSSFRKTQPDNTLTYSSEIPEMFVNYDYFKKKGADYELPEPPQLPAHLNNVLLNKISASNSNGQLSSMPHSFDKSEIKRPPLRRADSSYYASNKEAYHLSVPNHVILNHLMTTSIRNEVLTVACITRYSGKFVTQIMHSPAE